MLLIGVGGAGPVFMLRRRFFPLDTSHATHKNLSKLIYADGQHVSCLQYFRCKL